MRCMGAEKRLRRKCGRPQGFARQGVHVQAFRVGYTSVSESDTQCNRMFAYSHNGLRSILIAWLFLYLYVTHTKCLRTETGAFRCRGGSDVISLRSLTGGKGAEPPLPPAGAPPYSACGGLRPPQRVESRLADRVRVPEAGDAAARVPPVRVYLENGKFRCILRCRPQPENGGSEGRLAKSPHAEREGANSC